MDDLFVHAQASKDAREAPLAERMRPRTLDEFVGQSTVVGDGTLLRRAIEHDKLFSLILWGPPGCGKTTLARLMAQATRSFFVQFSAVMSGVQELKRIVEDAHHRRSLHRQRTVLFLDEIHRWNKAQQDALLPHVERGDLVLIGATTENPSFEVIGPLLSRSRVYVLQRLTEEHLATIVGRALNDATRGLGALQKTLGEDARDLLVANANGDARIALNTLELAATHAKGQTISAHDIRDALQRPSLLYDQRGEEHYNTISAFIKSIRGSDPDAGLYWLARMLDAGEDPLFIARRLVILASEDIGNADPHALLIAVATAHAVEFVGLPEAQLNLAQAVTYLASTRKSNASYVALERAKADVRETLNLPVPLHLRNAVTDLMKNLGYGKEYRYSHEYPEGSDERQQEYRPSPIARHRYYEPSEPAEQSLRKRPRP